MALLVHLIGTQQIACSYYLTHLQAHLYNGPLPALDGDGEAEHDVRGGAVAAVADHAHADVVAVGRALPDALHVITCRLGRGHG